MLVKCGRTEYELNKQDEIMFNGACYQITTRKEADGWHTKTPMIAKGKAERMIKDGLLILNRKEKRSMEVEIYKIKN